MRFLRFTSLLALTASLVMVGTARAQDGPPAGFQPPPEMMKKIRAWQEWRKNHKNISALEQTVNGLSAMDSDAKTRLTKDQAKRILPVLTTWRKKPAMTDAQAREVNRKLTSVLTVPQIKKIASIRSPMGGPGGGRPGGGPGGMSGPPGGMRPPMGGGPGGGDPGGGPPRMDPNMFPEPKDYNPLNPDTLPFEFARTMAKQRMDGLIKALQGR